MKKIAALVIIVLIFCNAAVSFSEEGNQRVTLSIVNATKFEDVNFVLTNLRRSSQVSGLSISLSSKNLVELSGNYLGETESLIAEVQGLAQNRFSFEITKKPPNLLITLKKL